MDGGVNDSKWTHNTSAVATAANHPFKMDFLTPSPRKTVVNFTLTAAAGRCVPALIIHTGRIDAAGIPRILPGGHMTTLQPQLRGSLGMLLYHKHAAS